MTPHAVPRYLEVIAGGPLKPRLGPALLRFADKMLMVLCWWDVGCGLTSAGGDGSDGSTEPGMSKPGHPVTLGLDEWNCAMHKVDSQSYTLKARRSRCELVYGRLALSRLLRAPLPPRRFS